MDCVTVTPHLFNESIIAGRWKVKTVLLRSSDLSNPLTLDYRADNYKALIDYLSSMKSKRVPVSIELVGVYYHDMYYALDGPVDPVYDLPADLSVFLYCIY